MKTLIITDVQRDFYCPEGALYVKGAEVLPEKIAKLAKNFDSVILTLDWHPGDHCSFKEQGGPWPPHCVAYTQGAGLPDSFRDILADEPLIFFKGQEVNREEYGAFAYLEKDDPMRTLFRMSDTIEICGIAGDYCVMETIKCLLTYVPASKIVVNLECTASIDGGGALDAFIKEKGLRTI